MPSWYWSGVFRECSGDGWEFANANIAGVDVTARYI